MSDAISYNNRVLWAGKTYIQFWLHMLNEEIDKMVDPPSWLRSAQDIWDEQAHSYVGELAPRFDYILTTQQRADLAAKLLRQAINRVAKSGAKIPLAELNRLGLGGGSSPIFTKDAAAEDYINVGEGLLRLLDSRNTHQTGGEPPLEEAANPDERVKRRQNFLKAYGGDADAAMRAIAEEWRKRRTKKGT